MSKPATLTGVFVASPGLAGHRGEAELDVARRVDDLYYKGRGEASATCVAYCYGIEHKDAVCAALDEMIREEEVMRDRHYARLLELRRRYGARQCGESTYLTNHKSAGSF